MGLWRIFKKSAYAKNVYIGKHEEEKGGAGFIGKDLLNL